MSNIFKSNYKGREIDSSIGDVATLKTDMAKTKIDIDNLKNNKANANTVPKSITDLEPNASLVYMGKTEPPPHYSLWVYPVNNTVAILRARDANGRWIDVVGESEDDSDTQLYIATLGFEYEVNEDGWYSVTESLKHNNVEIGAGEIFDAYESGNTVILVANDRDIFQLTSAYMVDDTALVEFSRTNNSEHWTIEVYGSEASVREHTGRMEDSNNKVWDADIAGVEQYEDSFEKYPSMVSMIGYVRNVTNPIIKDVANKSDVIKLTTDTSKRHVFVDSEEATLDELNLYGAADNPTIMVFGKNYLQYPYTTGTLTKNGVTFTDNGDGTITVNGTATANAYYRIINDGMPLKAGTYFLSGCPDGGSTSTYFMAIANHLSSYTKYNTEIGNGKSFVSEDEMWYPQIRIMAGTTVENLVFKPYIELGETSTKQEVAIPYVFGDDDSLVLKEGVVKTTINGVTKSITSTTVGQALRKLHTNLTDTTILCDAECNVTYTVNSKSAYCNLKQLRYIQSVTIKADKWVEEDVLDAGGNVIGSRFGQVVTVENATITPNSKVDLQISSEQAIIFRNKSLAFVAENDDGIVTIYCVGDKPQNDYTMQVTVTEVFVNG